MYPVRSDRLGTATSEVFKRCQQITRIRLEICCSETIASLLRFDFVVSKLAIQNVVLRHSLPSLDTTFIPQLDLEHIACEAKTASS